MKQIKLDKPTFTGQSRLHESNELLNERKYEYMIPK